ncbi:MAG TPA: N-formylglutamate amidohydrolase [Alphaproteobacteria bacterium]|nr:N-formylglutamate amidohydrolase [Alphaproteobacteria bacterium]
MKQSRDHPVQPFAPLLSADEPPAFETINLEGTAPFLLICDHASRRVPMSLGSLGLEATLLRRHIGWDIGAAEVARWLSKHFDAPLALTGYSRLVIDCNRALTDPSSIPILSDGVVVPGNRQLEPIDAKRRQEALFHPYHAAIDEILAGFRARRRVPGLVSIHSFTPVFDGFERPWQIGILWDRDPRVALPLMAELRKSPGLDVGDNQPYSAREPKGYSVTTHAVAHGYPHVAVEIRQDLIDTNHGAAAWAERFADALAPVMREDSIYRVEHFK